MAGLLFIVEARIIRVWSTREIQIYTREPISVREGARARETDRYIVVVVDDAVVFFLVFQIQMWVDCPIMPIVFPTYASSNRYDSKQHQKFRAPWARW